VAANALTNRDMQNRARPAIIRCAIYTRKSTEEGLEQDFNTLDAQREAAESFIRSQRHEGWGCGGKALRRRRLHRREHGAARPEAAAGRHRHGLK